MSAWILGLLVLGLIPFLPPPSHTTAIPSPESTSAPLFPGNVRITDGSSPFPHQVEPYIAVDSQGTLFVGWKEAESPEGPGRRVGFARSEDGGLTWSSNVLMDRRASDRFQSDPWLVVDEADRLYYSRLEFEEGPGNGVAVSHSDDGGASWSAIVEVDDQPGFADKESMVSDGNGTLYLAYDDVSLVGDDASIRFTHSTNQGVTWAATTEVGDGPGTFLSPVIATRPNGTVYVAWLDWLLGNILVATSWDRGFTWGTPIRVNPVSGTAALDPMRSFWWISLPSIVADTQGRVYVAWPDRGTGDLDVLVARSEDDGLSWSPPIRINDDASGREQRMVSLAVDANNGLHAAWYDNRTGSLNVFYSNSTDRGETWSTNERVTTAETSSTFQRPGDYLGLTTDRNGTPYVVWTDGRSGNLDIYFARPGPSEEPDVEAPFIEIRSPEEGETFTSTRLAVSGTAQDNVAVDRVEVSSDNGTTWIRATGTTLWSHELELPVGETTVLARATDTSENAARASVTVSVIVEPEEPVPPEPPYLIILVVAGAATIALITWVIVRRRTG